MSCPIQCQLHMKHNLLCFLSVPRENEVCFDGFSTTLRAVITLGFSKESFSSQTAKAHYDECLEPLFALYQRHNQDKYQLMSIKRHINGLPSDPSRYE